MNARRGWVGRLAWLGLAALLTVACSKDKKTLLLLDVSLQPDVPAPASVTVDVTLVDGSTAGAVTFDWSSTESGPQRFGLYLPDGVVGNVKVRATSTTSTVSLSSGYVDASVEADKTNGPVGLILQAVVVVGDAGVEDSGVPPSEDASVYDGGDDAPTGDDAMGDGSAADDASGDGAGDADGGLAWGPAENVEKDPTSRSDDPVIAVEPISENVFVAWLETSSVKVMRYDRKTGTWGAAKTLESRGSPDKVAVGTDAAGNIMVAWMQNWSTTDPTLPGVWVSQSSDGSKWSDPQQVASARTFSLSFAMARNGFARLAWSSQTGDLQKSVFTAYFDKTSWAADPTPVIDPNDPADYDATDPEPVMMMGGNGDGILVLKVRDANRQESLAAVNLTATTRSPLQILDTESRKGVASLYRSSAMNINGEGVVVWPEPNSTDTSSLNLAYYQPTRGWLPTQKIADGPEFNTSGVSLDANGQVTVAWVQKLAATGRNVMAIHGKAAGSWSDIAQLELDNIAGGVTTDYAYPVLAADGAGNVLAVWKKKIDASTFGAYGSRLHGGKWQPEVKLGQKAGLKPTPPRVAVADSGFGAATFAYFSTSGSSTDPDAYNVEVALFR